MIEVKNGEVEFRFHCPQARQVFLVGDFNNWDPRAQPMQRNGHGEWVSRLRLAEGVYQFRYCADGEWHTDYAAFGVEYVPFGCNSVLVMPDSDLCGVPL